MFINIINIILGCIIIYLLIIIQYKSNTFLSFIPDYNNNNSNIQNNEKDNEIEKLKNEISKLNNENSSLKDENQRLKNEINKLKSEFNNNKKILVDKNEMLTIQIKSIDQTVDKAYTCQKNDIFVRIEEELYNDYPQYKDLNTYFTVNGRIVKRFRSMLENNIRKNDKILLNIYE